MARSHYRGTVYGNLTTGAKPLPGAAIRLFHPDTGQPWALPVYPDPVNGVPYTLPILTNPVGEVELWADDPARVAITVSHPSYYGSGGVIDIEPHPATAATDGDMAEAVAEHEAKVDPHPQYLTAQRGDDLFLTPVEGDLRYLPIGSTPPVFDGYTKSESDARYEPLDSAYTKAEADARYEPLDSAYTKAEADARYPLQTDPDPYPQYLTAADVTPTDVTVTTDGSLTSTESPADTFALGVRLSPDAGNALALRGNGLYGTDTTGAGGAYVDEAGDTMTGALVLQGAGATANVLQAKLAADAQPRFRADASGLQEWGPGGATAPDTGLSRSAAATLQVNGHLLPNANNTRTLGTSLRLWNRAYLQECDVNSYLILGSSLQASAGTIRMQHASLIAWRNAAATGNLTLGVDTSDRLAYSGTTLTLAGDTAATLQRTGAGALRADTNLGVGVAPAAWGSTHRALQVGASGAVWGEAASPGSVVVSANTYFDGTNFRSLSNTSAAFAQVSSAGLGVHTAPAVAAAAVQTFTSRLALAQTGTLTISPDGGQYALSVPGILRGTTDLELSSANHVYLSPTSGYVVPNADNTKTLGHSGIRWVTVYAVSGVVNSSTHTAKSGITPLDPAACYQAAKDVVWYEFAYLPPAYQEPEPPPDIAYDAADDNETKAAKKALRDEGEAQAKAAHLKLVAETAPARHQRGFVFPAGAEAKDEAGGTLPPVPALFGLPDRESTTPQADLATLGAALQEVIRRLEALEGAPAR